MTCPDIKLAGQAERTIVSSYEIRVQAFSRVIGATFEVDNRRATNTPIGTGVDNEKSKCAFKMVQTAIGSSFQVSHHS
jgi:hypothetical protein